MTEKELFPNLKNVENFFDKKAIEKTAKEIEKVKRRIKDEWWKSTKGTFRPKEYIHRCWCSSKTQTKT